MKQTVILVILDGWGIGPMNESNPIYIAEPKNLTMIQRHFPSAALQASGIAVGLPWEEEGNSEVGHLTIGAGKIIYQYFPRISMAIENGAFFNNLALKNAFTHAKKNNSAVNFVGLLSNGNVHASIAHLEALLEFADKEKIEKVRLHLFADGKDSPPQSFLALLKRLDAAKENSTNKISSIAGRYYAMNRDLHWERTKEAYKALVGEAPQADSIVETIDETYEKGLNDDFVGPVVVGKPRPIEENDAIIFFNFREDSMRQLSECFLNPTFDKFPVKKIDKNYVVTFTDYQDDLKTNIAFPKEKIEKPLGKVLAMNGKRQLRVAETEKYAHVTYFFNGLEDKPFPEEYRILIPSQSVLHHDEHPEMRASQITDRALVSLNEGSFDFILINYANPDIVAHTGNYDATIKAVKVIDEEIGRLFKAVMENKHTLIITADHGNAEVVLDLTTGQKETKHDANPVPIYIVNEIFKKKSPVNELNRLPIVGLLSDVAPTVLGLMRIEKPKEMTGQSLLSQLL